MGSFDNPEFAKRVMDICVKALEAEGLEIQNYDETKGFDVNGYIAHINVKFGDW